jgi:hypothetical protein
MAKRPLVVSSLAALAAACGGHVTTDNPQDEAVGTAQPLTNTCSSTTPTGGWVNRSFGSHSGAFSVDVDLTPSARPSDALFGLSTGAATTYTSMANIIRFNPDGFVDVRNGNGYAADQSLPYSAGSPMHFSIDVNTVNHTYSVRQWSTLLASNYAFRTEQSGVAQIDNYALKVDAGGSVSACNVAVTDGCRTAGPNSGFVNNGFASQDVFFTSSFTATPSAPGIDGVVGFSTAAATTFNAVAAAVRFNPSGKIDVRNGNAYTADFDMPYTAGTSYTIELLTDIVGHTYSVVVNGLPLARNYAFRTQQASATSLANWALISDSAVGALTVCGFQPLPSLDTGYVHDLVSYAGGSGGGMAAPVDGSLVLSNASQTSFLDATGRPVASMLHGGNPATDAHGNLYLAGPFQGSYDGGGGPLPSHGGSDVYVSKYDGAHQHLWSRALGTTNDDALGELSVNAAGDVLVGVGAQMVRLAPTGADAWTLPLDSPNVKYSIDPSGGAFWLRDHFPVWENFTILRLDAAGHTLWSRTFALTQGGADVRFIRSDPSGNAILGGGLNGRIDFVEGTLAATSSEDGNQAFVAKLDQNAFYLWGAIGNMNSVLDMEVDNAGRAVISGYRNNPVQFRLNRFAADGRGELAEDGSRLTPGFQFGTGRDVAVAATGNIYWQFNITRSAVGLSYLAQITP